MEGRMSTIMPYRIEKDLSVVIHLKAVRKDWHTMDMGSFRNKGYHSKVFRMDEARKTIEKSWTPKANLEELCTNDVSRIFCCFFLMFN